MKPAPQRRGRLVVLALALALPLVALPACGKKKTGTVATEESPATPPGAEARVPYDRLEYAADGTFTLDGKKFTGVAQEFHPDGKTLSKLYEYKDGVFDGTTREYYENGQASSSTQWQKGKRHGANLYWDEDGNAIKRQRYEHDVAVETVEMDENGNPKP